MTSVINNLTTKLQLPLPNAQNNLMVDVERIRQALSLIDLAYGELDLALSGKANQSDLSGIMNQLNAIKGTVPDTLNTLQKLASAIGNDPNYANTQAGQITSLTNAQNTQAGQITSLTNAQVPIELVYAGI